MQVDANNPNPIQGAQPVQQGQVAMGHGPQRVDEPPAPVDTGADKPPFHAIAELLEVNPSTGMSAKYPLASLFTSTYQFEIKGMSTYKGENGKMYYQVVVDRKITIPPSTTPIEIKNKVVQTLVPVPNPFTDRAAERIEKLVRLTVGATEKRMEQAVKFSDVRAKIMDEKFIICCSLNMKKPGQPAINRHGNVEAFDVYAIKVHANGGYSTYPVHQEGNKSIMSRDPFMDSFKDFSRSISAPITCEHNNKFLTKLKTAEKLVHELVQAATAHPPTLDYDSKLGALNTLLEEDPPISLDTLLATMERNTVDDLYALKTNLPLGQSRKLDPSILPSWIYSPWHDVAVLAREANKKTEEAIMAAEFDKKAVAASAPYKKAKEALEVFKEADAAVSKQEKILENMDRQPHDPQMRIALVSHIKSLKENLARAFDACVKPLLVDTYNRIDGNMRALEHFRTDPRGQEALQGDLGKHTRKLAALNRGSNQKILVHHRVLQNLFLEKAGPAAPRFQAMLAQRRDAALQNRAPISGAPKARGAPNLLRP